MSTVPPGTSPNTKAPPGPSDAQDSCAEETGSQNTGAYVAFMCHWSFLEQVASRSGGSFARLLPEVKAEATSHFEDGQDRHQTIDRLLTQFQHDRASRPMLWDFSDNQALTDQVKDTIARMKEIAKTRTADLSERFHEYVAHPFPELQRAIQTYPAALNWAAPQLLSRPTYRRLILTISPSCRDRGGRTQILTGTSTSKQLGL